MVFVTAVYLIIRQRRRGPARHEATRAGTEHVNSHSEYENASHLVDGRTERHNATLRETTSGEAFLRVPPPAYIPGETASWQGGMEEFRVGADVPSTRPALRRFSNSKQKIGLLANEVGAVLNHVTSTYFTDLAEAGVGSLMPIDAGGLRPLRGWKCIIEFWTPTYRPVCASPQTLSLPEPTTVDYAPRPLQLQPSNSSPQVVTSHV
jgi:hypothetical protein